jgi:chaperonin GroES
MNSVLNLPVLAVGGSVCQKSNRCLPATPTGPRGGIGCQSSLLEPRAPPNGVAFEGAGSMKIRPLQDRIIVKRVDGEETSKGGIIIPDSAKEKPQEGKVIAVGKGKVNEDGKVQKLDVKKGDKILFSKYAGTEINIEGDEHLIIREDDVLGVVE